MDSLSIATDRFVTNAGWLTQHDQAAITALKHVAEQADSQKTAALYTLWFKLYSDLRNRKQEESTEVVSDDEQALRDLGI